MTATSTLAACCSSLPTPKRPTDIFDFLHAKKEPVTEKNVRVEEAETPDFLVVTIEQDDGRSLRRNVPAKAWQNKEYRAGLLQNLSLLVA